MFGESEAVFVANVACTGSEEDILMCRHTVNLGQLCSHERDVGLRCERKSVIL